VAAAPWADWPPDRVAAAKISTALDTLVGTNEALAASTPVDSGGHGKAHAAAMLAERQGAGIGGLDPWLVLRRRSIYNTETLPRESAQIDGCAAHARAGAQARNWCIGRPWLTLPDKIEYARLLRDQGHTLGQIAAKTGIPKTSLHATRPATGSW
jgi:hypothetical protein